MTMHPAIRVSNLSKKYIIGGQEKGYRTFREAVLDAVLSPLQRLRSHPTQEEVEQNEFWALRDVSFDIPQGKIVGIIGRNGAGKSTLLKVLSKITEPTSGRVEIRGRVGSLLEVGTGFHPELTGRENIYMNGSILGMRKAEITRKFDEIVAFSEIEKFLDTPVKHYSSGMYVRLAFAVAAHLEPEILIVDEVLAVGDAQFQKKCLGKMQDVGKNGRTVLFVSHNMGAIKNLCNEIIVLKDGKVNFKGKVSSGIASYLKTYSICSDVVRWENEIAPKTTSAKLIEVGIMSNYSMVGTELNTELPIQIYIIFEVFKENKVGTTVVLHDEEGNIVFASISNNENKWHGKVRRLGVYKSTCEIPPNLLSEGKYYISIPLWEGHYQDGIVEKDVISFNAVEHGLVRGDLPYESQGIIRPYLKWTSELIETVN